jgi:hypothetical protein
MTNLRDAAARLDVAPDTPDAFSVRGYERVLEEATRIIHSAQHIRPCWGLFPLQDRSTGRRSDETGVGEPVHLRAVCIDGSRQQNGLPFRVT